MYGLCLTIYRWNLNVFAKNIAIVYKNYLEVTIINIDHVCGLILYVYTTYILIVVF